MAFMMAAIQPTIMRFVSLGISIYSIKKGWLIPEYSILFMLISIILPSSLISIMQIGNYFKMGQHSVNNLLQLYANKDQEFSDHPKSFTMGDIEFKDVSFSYD